MKKMIRLAVKRPYQTLLWITLFALASRLLVGSFFYNSFDLKIYNIPWALGMQDGLFSCYENIKNLNYPPIFPFLLSFVSPLVRLGQDADIWQLTMLGIKLVPILFDAAVGILLYFALKKGSEKKALLAAAIWAVNPVTFFNSAFWGQADGMLLFFIGLTFLMFYQKKPVWGTVCFALGCLAKLQMLYFAPVILCELFFRYPIKKSFNALLVGLAAGLCGWLPFMIGSGELFLPLRIYLGGFEQYEELNMYAYNVYSLPFLQGMHMDSPVFGSFGPDYGQVAQALMGAVLLFVPVHYFVCKKKKIELPAFLPAMIYMNGIFMLTPKQHERYQIPVLILAALCCFFLKDKRFRIPFGAMLAIPFMNEFFGLLSVLYPVVFSPMTSAAMVIGSAANIIVFAYMIYLYVQAMQQGRAQQMIRFTSL